MRPAGRAAILFLSTMSLFCQCAHLVQKREDYEVSGKEPEVLGARITAEMIPTDGKANYSVNAMVYFVAGGTETGPYKCLLTAWGDRAQHEFMSVKNLKFRTASGQTASVAGERRVAFAPGGIDGNGWQATYVVPGVLSLDFAKDGEVTLEGHVGIGTKRRHIREDIRLTLSPTQSKEVRFETIFDGLRKKE